jgi:adenylate cyclase
VRCDDVPVAKGTGGEDTRDAEDSRAQPKLRDRARRADTQPELVATARLIRRLLPGDESYGERTAAASGAQLRARLGRSLAELTPDRPSTMRELGLGVLQAWQALSEAQQRRRGAAQTVILFTDLVGFSAWALEAGDEAAIELLGQVEDAEATAILDHAGIVVKRLGDGSMAVFSHPEQAVHAAHEAQGRLDEIEVRGYTPRLRAGIHLGRPRKVGKDYLGVDVNVAARIGDAAKGGQVLISEPARELVDPAEFRFGRAKRLKAPGTPDELLVSTVKPRG